MKTLVFTAETNAPRLDKYLVTLVPSRTRSFFRHLIKEGGVLVDGKAAEAADKVKPGNIITIHLPAPQPIEAAAQDIPLDIVYEDSDILIVDKPKGMVTHPAPGSRDGTLVNALLYHIKDLSGINGKLRPGIVHRLDKDTTGLLVVAKNDAAHVCLAKQIKEKKALRIYTALCYGNIPQDTGVIDAPIARHPKNRKKMAVVPGGRAAVSAYRVLARYGAYTLVEVSLKTGRTHQIRVHMAHIGHPVVGDAVYTRRKGPFETEGQMLHAGRLVLYHPATGEKMEFLAPLPAYFQEVLEKIEPLRQ